MRPGRTQPRGAVLTANPPPRTNAVEAVFVAIVGWAVLLVLGSQLWAAARLWQTLGEARVGITERQDRALLSLERSAPAGRPAEPLPEESAPDGADRSLQ